MPEQAVGGAFHEHQIIYFRPDHESIKNVTPADVYLGQDKAIL